jgi:PD-(D/E)XK endonuclease
MDRTDAALNLKGKGDLAELKVASDLVARGHRIAIPYGEDCDYDLIADTGNRLHRIQVKYTASDEAKVTVRCRSLSLTNGKAKKYKHYTAEMVDWIAVYHRASDSCYYIDASELGDGRVELTLRLTPPRNGQRVGIRFAEDYRGFPRQRREALPKVEPAGLEPATSALQTPRSAN